MLVPSSSHRGGKNWLQERFGKVKVRGENGNEKQPTRKTKRLGGCKRSESGLGEGRLKMYMGGPAIFVHREGFNHISLVTLLKRCVLFRAPHFQTSQSRQALGAGYFLLAGCCFEGLCRISETHGTELEALCRASVRMCELHQRWRYSTPAGWTQTERCSGDIPLPNPSNVAGQSESRTGFANVGPTHFPCTSMATLPLPFVFVVSEP